MENVFRIKKSRDGPAKSKQQDSLGTLDSVHQTIVSSMRESRMNIDELRKRKEELEKAELDLVELQKTRFGVSGEYFQKRQELIKPIQDKIYDAMQKVASKRSYSFIFDKANQSNLIFADKKFDLSDDVIKEMGLKP